MAGQPVSAVSGRIDWLALTPEAQATIREIVLPLHFGFSHTEIADSLAIKQRLVQHRLARLRREIRAQLDEGAA